MDARSNAARPSEQTAIVRTPVAAVADDVSNDASGSVYTHSVIGSCTALAWLAESCAIESLGEVSTRKRREHSTRTT